MLTVFLAAFGASLLLTPAAGWLSRRAGILATPGGRRKHAGKIPKLGGVSLFLAFLLAIGVAWLTIPAGGDDARRLRGVLLGGGVMFVGGLVDDRYELSPGVNFAIQIIAALIAIGHIIFIEVFTNPLTGQEVWFNDKQWLVWLVTLFWILGMVNTVNFLDGLDGLAAGVGTIAALLFAWHSYRLGQTAVSLFPLALAGILLGFLPYNFTPARIFLGSAGAYVLGYNLATLSILAPAKIATALLVMAVPILDVAWQIYSRLRRGQSPLKGDRGHLHYRLADAGIPTPVIVIGYYLISVAFGLVAVLASGAKVKLLMLLLLTSLLLLLFVWLNKKGQKNGAITP